MFSQLAFLARMAASTGRGTAAGSRPSLGFGRIVVSDIEAPNLSVNLV
jgi:hypothetical protein